MTYIYVVLVSFCYITLSFSMTKKEKNELRDTVKDMFHHAYDSYMKHAFPADELMPLMCKGRYRGSEASRGDVDDILGNFSMTLIDSLDSLAILGEVEKFEIGVKLVIKNVKFNNDIVVSVFETNIRVLGGLLGGHVAAVAFKRDGHGMMWYNDELLSLAKDIGERLLPAFNTTTGIPYPRVNLKYGIIHPQSRTGTESDTCTACAGTMIMEFGALSRLTGDPVFEAVAHKAMMSLWRYRSRTSDLVGTVINIHNGEWVRRDSGVGAGIDSYYEYCLKAYILLGEEEYLQRFNQHYKAIMRYVNKESIFLNVHMHNPSKPSNSHVDALQAFWPGLQVLKGDLKSAIELHEVFYSVAKRHTFLPEAFTTNLEVHWGQHLLRPELVESTYFLYEATKDPYYLDVGKYIVENLNRYTRVPCGFAAVKDVRTLSHEDRMDSFLLSETLKYLFLLFSDTKELLIDIHDFVFTTEAHILPLALSNWNGSSDQNYLQSQHIHDHSCPRQTNDKSLMTFAEEVRRKSRSKRKVIRRQCQTRTSQKVATNRPPLLRAEQFIPGNTDHIQILKSMGITVTKTAEGRVQLMQNAAMASTTDLATEGIQFMQSMIELAKFRNEDGAENLPRVVQILTAPYNGHIVLNAGPAQFGIDLVKTGMGVSGEVVLADPIKGCTALSNKEVVDHRIVIMERGQCMFVDKARQAMNAGAVAAVIIDNNEGSSSELQPIFSMSGDSTSNDINIPAVFLFALEGDILKKAMQLIEKTTGGYLKIRLGDKAVETDIPRSTESTTESHKEMKSSQSTGNKDKTAMPPTQDNKLKTVGDLMKIMEKLTGEPGFDFMTKYKSSKMPDVVDKVFNDESLMNIEMKQKVAVNADLNALDKYKEMMVKSHLKSSTSCTSMHNGEGTVVCANVIKSDANDVTTLHCSQKSDMDCNNKDCVSVKMGDYEAVLNEDGTILSEIEVTYRGDKGDQETQVVGNADNQSDSGSNESEDEVINEMKGDSTKQKQGVNIKTSDQVNQQTGNLNDMRTTNNNIDKT